MNMIKLISKGMLFLSILFLCGYFLYLQLPYPSIVYVSPHGNAEIRKIVKGRNSIFYPLFSPFPEEMYYVVICQGDEIAKVNVECSGCSTHVVLDVIWYRDSVRVSHVNWHSNHTQSRISKGFVLNVHADE